MFQEPIPWSLGRAVYTAILWLTIMLGQKRPRSLVCDWSGCDTCIASWGVSGGTPTHISKRRLYVFLSKSDVSGILCFCLQVHVHVARGGALLRGAARKLRGHRAADDGHRHDGGATSCCAGVWRVCVLACTAMGVAGCVSRKIMKVLWRNHHHRDACSKSQHLNAPLSCVTTELCKKRYLAQSTLNRCSDSPKKTCKDAPLYASRLQSLSLITAQQKASQRRRTTSRSVRSASPSSTPSTARVTCCATTTPCWRGSRASRSSRRTSRCRATRTPARVCVSSYFRIWTCSIYASSTGRGVWAEMADFALSQTQERSHATSPPACRTWKWNTPSDKPWVEPESNPDDGPQVDPQPVLFLRQKFVDQKVQTFAVWGLLLLFLLVVFQNRDTKSHVREIPLAATPNPSRITNVAFDRVRCLRTNSKATSERYKFFDVRAAIKVNGCTKILCRK